MIMSHDRSQFDSLTHTERGVVNLMWLTLVRPYVVRAYEENVLSLHCQGPIKAGLDRSLTLEPTVPLSRTHTNRPSWRRRAANPAAEPPQQNPHKSSSLGLHIYSLSPTLNMILIVANWSLSLSLSSPSIILLVHPMMKSSLPSTSLPSAYQKGFIGMRAHSI
jgi:hypothetical protein